LENFEPLSHFDLEDGQGEDEVAVDEEEAEEEDLQRRWGFTFDEFNAGVEGGF
jgi:hypothetical protein